MAKKKEKKIRPIGDKILVKRMVAEEKTQGGIIIPDSSQENLLREKLYLSEMEDLIIKVMLLLLH